MSISFRASLKAIAWFYKMFVPLLWYFQVAYFVILELDSTHFSFTLIIMENGSKGIFQKLAFWVSQKKRSYGLGPQKDAQTIFHF